ncbi:hypothetical protein GGR53DRAFT_474907 [Hypoxylon sp. FL1150]|nr:hypothetical protein GGR53DRAFT_474907 [Hypoxylon sp. FL1150]
MQLAGWSIRQTSFPLCSISYGTLTLLLMPLLLLFTFQVFYFSLSDTLFYILVSSFLSCLSLTHDLGRLLLFLVFSFSLIRFFFSFIVRVLV